MWRTSTVCASLAAILNAAVISPICASNRDEQWIFRSVGPNKGNGVVVFMSSDYSQVLFRVRCQPGGLLVVQYFGERPSLDRDRPLAIILNEEGDDQLNLGMQTRVAEYGGHPILEGRLELTSSIKSSVVLAREISIDAPNEMDEPWRTGTAAILKGLIQSCE